MDQQTIANLISAATAESMSMNAQNGGQASFKPEIRNPYNMPEYVGTVDTGKCIGLVVANLDNALHEALELEPQYRSIGIFSGRVGACEEINACDVAVKSTNTTIHKVELCRDSMGGGGHGCTVIFASENVEDCRRAIEIALEETINTFADVYVNDGGHLELHYSANSGEALHKAFGVPIGRPFGMVGACPAAVGMIMCDHALKQGDIEILGYLDSLQGTKMTNEVLITFTGDAAAVKSAVLAGREVGLGLLASFGEVPKSMTRPGIF